MRVFGNDFTPEDDVDAPLVPPPPPPPPIAINAYVVSADGTRVDEESRKKEQKREHVKAFHLSNNVRVTREQRKRVYGTAIDLTPEDGHEASFAHWSAPPSTMIVDDLLKDAEFVNRELALGAHEPNVDKLQTVSRLITIGLRGLAYRAASASDGMCASANDELVSVVNDILKGSELVDACLRSDALDLHHVRMLSRLISISLRTLNDSKSQGA